MTKNLTDILTEGFGLWKNNLILGVPPLLSWIIQSVLWFVIVVVMLIAIFGVGFGTGLFLGDFENIDNLIESLAAVLITVLLIIFVMIIITLMIEAFFTAGLIGMAKETVETGKTQLSTMTEYGKRKFISLFFANLIIMIIALLPLIITGIIFLILIAVGYIGMPDYSDIDAMALKMVSLLLLFLVIFMLWLLYLLIISIILAVVNYTVVISDTGAVEGIKRGYKFFMDHKQDVFFMWLIIGGIAIFCVGIYLVVGITLEFIPIIGLIIGFFVDILFSVFMAVVFTPLIAVWWSWLYMDRKQLPQMNIEPSKSSSEISG